MKNNISQANNGLLYVSIVIPLYNEEDNAQILYEQIKDVLEKLGVSYEIIFVDDGSRDTTYEILESIFRKDDKVQVIQLRKNFGQTPALAAGIDCAKGEIIITMDGDMQHDPHEIPLFLKKIEEGFDIVSGWRQKRVDSFFTRRLPSLVANKIMATLSGVQLHDFGTTFKAYRQEVIKNVELFGELHRFIPALISSQGVSIVEIPIKNIVRKKGKSSYGLSRTIRVILDLILVKFLVSYSTKPLQFFGFFGLFFFFSGALIEIRLFVGRVVFNIPVLEHAPLMMLGILLIVVGVQFITFGLLGEMLTRIYHKTNNLKIYSVKKALKRAIKNTRG